MNPIAASIVALNQKLLGAPFDYAFLGGSVLSLLVNDPLADAIRVTMDVDIIADVRTRSDFHKEERELESRGFMHDTSEDAPVCRWISDGIVVDVLPIREDVLGWNSPWFEEALHVAQIMDVEGHAVKKMQSWDSCRPKAIQRNATPTSWRPSSALRILDEREAVPEEGFGLRRGAGRW